jgi:hypothetical protein
MRRAIQATFTAGAFAAAITIAPMMATNAAPAGDEQATAGQAPAGQQPAGQPGQGRGAGRGQGQTGGGGRGAQPLDLADRTGFEPIFDGTLKNWDGDPALWRVENGMLVGQTTAENAIKENTFAIWRGGEPADFELKLEYRMDAGNSGIQFRSEHLTQGTPSGKGSIAGKWVLKGYQADMDHANQYTGMIYEERGRGFIMQRGQAVHIAPDATRRVVGHLERNADELKAIIKGDDWNHVHLIARGNMIINMMNGHVTAILVDDDPKGRAMKGLLGLQLHTGPPMKIEFRNISLKKL